jgi:phage recombination protein Bet
MTASTELVATTGGVPEAVQRRGITESQWRTLCLSLFPGASANSVLMVIDYCKARKLDPLKKPCHIVPMEVKKAGTNQYEWRDVVMPGIYEHRTTAQRTGEYLGHSKAEYGPDIPFTGSVAVPEWCSMTIYRWNAASSQRVEFPVTVFFREVVATNREGKPNARWARAPRQMMTKCCEAAGLREAFPDEIGGEMTAEEMDGQRAVDVVVESKPALPKPEKYDEWLTDLLAAIESGDEWGDSWVQSPQEHRLYLAETDAATFDQIKAKASE